jgi:hypothetical protein
MAFLGLAAVAMFGFMAMWASMPETVPTGDGAPRE